MGYLVPPAVQAGFGVIVNVQVSRFIVPENCPEMRLLGGVETRYNISAQACLGFLSRFPIYRLQYD